MKDKSVIHLYLFGVGRISICFSTPKIAQEVYKNIEANVKHNVDLAAHTHGIIMEIPEHTMIVDTAQIIAIILEKEMEPDLLKEALTANIEYMNRELKGEAWQNGEDADEHY